MLWDDIDAAESFDPTIAALSEEEMQTPVGVFVAELAVPTLAERMIRLGEMWSEQSLADAARQLQEEDARWRAAGDDRTFPSIIHRTVSVLEEVTWQLAYRELDRARNPRTRSAGLRSALRVLKRRGVITGSERERILQAWDLRSKTPGAGHRVDELLGRRQGSSCSECAKACAIFSMASTLKSRRMPV